MASITESKIRGRDLELSMPNGGYGARANVVIGVITDEPMGAIDTYNLGTALTSPNQALPLRGHTWNIDGEVDSSLYCTRISARASDNPVSWTRWDFTCEYNSLLSTGGGLLPGDFVANPLSRPIHEWNESEVITELVLEAWNVNDIENKAAPRFAGTKGPIQNAAGGEYDETPLRERQVTILCARANFGSHQEVLDIRAMYDESLSSDTFREYLPHHAQFRRIDTGPPLFENGITYWQATMRIAVSEKPFYLPIVNRGWKYYDDGVGTFTMTEHKGAEPALLETNGEKLPDGELGNSILYRTTDNLMPYNALGI